MSKHYDLRIYHRPHNKNLSRLIKSLVKNNFFTIDWITKDGSFRSKNAHANVKKHLKRGKNFNDPTVFFTVYSLKDKAYNNAAWSNIISIKIDKTDHRFL